MRKADNPIELLIEEIQRRIIPIRTFANTPETERIVCRIITYILNPRPEMPARTGISTPGGESG